MSNKIQFRRGVKANLPTLSVAEPAFTTDTNEFFVGNGTSNIQLVQSTTTDVTYYVDATNGNDSNNGTSSGTAFKTIQYAINKLPQIINHVVTVNLIAGTYNEDVIVKGFYGKGSLKISGASGVNVSSISSYNICMEYSISAIAITTTTKTGIYMSRVVGGSINTINMTTSATSQYGIQCEYSIVGMGGCTISNRNYGIYAYSMSTLFCSGISGSGNGICIFAAASATIGTISNTITGSVPSATAAGGVIR